jgi:secretion/DNA translocation related TadE-like protein
MMVGFLGLLLMVGTGVGASAGAFVAHRRAESAADLAALAAAGAVVRGVEPCGEAERIAAANGGELRGCEPDREAVVVEVVVPGPRAFGRVTELVGRARAGPASAG